MNSILYPGRFTLLLGPPGAGKSTLLNALAGRLHKSSNVTTTGTVSYNGKTFDQFRAVHTAAYVDQNDLHQPELTVRETFNFAARCQGTGHKAGRSAMPCLLSSQIKEVQGQSCLFAVLCGSYLLLVMCCI